MSIVAEISAFQLACLNIVVLISNDLNTELRQTHVKPLTEKIRSI